MEIPNTIPKLLIFNPDNPTLIFTMEKVGSTTVMEAIKSAGLEAERVTKKTVKNFPYVDSRIITIVRDPIAWAISYYWEMPNAHPEQLVEPERFGSIENFMLNLNLDYAQTWLDEYFREIIGVHLYGQHFPKKKGWRTYSLERVLVLNTEKLSDNLADALAEFLGKSPQDFTIEHRAKGDDRHEGYKEFKENVKFPRTFLHDLYEARFCLFFFNFPDRKKWLERWVR